MKKLISYILIVICLFVSPAVVLAEGEDIITHFKDGTTTIDFPEVYEVDVPEGWLRSEFDDKLTDIMFMYPLGDTSFVIGLNRIEYEEGLDQSTDDLTLKLSAKAAIEGALGEGNADAPEMAKLSNGERCSIASGVVQNGQTPVIGIALSRYCGNAVFVASMFGDPSHVSNSDFFDDIDSILCSVKETK